MFYFCIILSTIDTPTLVFQAYKKKMVLIVIGGHDFFLCSPNQYINLPSHRLMLEMQLPFFSSSITKLHF
jgi:hypothetical protein